MARPHLRPFCSVDQQLLLPNLVPLQGFMSIAMEACSAPNYWTRWVEIKPWRYAVAPQQWQAAAALDQTGSPWRGV